MTELFKASLRAVTWPHREKPFERGGAFRPIGQDGKLRRLAMRGAGARVLSQGLALGLQMIGTVVLARLLTPSDFGVVAMVTTFSLLLMSFGLNGFTEAMIQWDDLDHSTASNLFWITMAGGVLLTVGFAGMGSLLARFYHNALVANITIVLAPTILISCASYPHLALLKRAMRFPALSANDVIARGAWVAVSVVLAFRGWGYWALVAGLIAQPLSTAIGAWWLCDWMPSLPKRTARTGSMVRFAFIVYARYGIRYGARNLDKLLVGWRFNAAALGFYKKAYDLFALAANQSVAPIEDVALATLSRLKRDLAKYKRYLMNGMAVIAFGGMGLSLVLTLTGPEIIRVVLGPGWEESGRIFVFLGPGIGMMLLHGVHSWIHLSIGRPDRWIRWTVAEFVVTAGLLFAALPWGPEGIAAAWSVAFWVLTLPAIWYAGRPIRLGFRPMIGAIWKFIAAAVLAGGAAFPIVRELPSFAAIPGAAAALARIVIISGIAGAFYLGFIILLHRGCAPLYQFAGVLKEMLPRRKEAPAEAALVTQAR